MLKPEHLLTLREVIQRGSFAAAANRLGYTASAVSQQMAALEREIGVRLFHRSAHSVLPTGAAEVMARHATTVLNDIDRLVAATQAAHRNTERQVRLGVFPSFGLNVLGEAIGRLPAGDRTGFRISVAEPSQLIPHLGESGELDAAIVYQVGNSGLSWPTSVDRRWIAEDRFRVVLPRAWLSTPRQTSSWPTSRGSGSAAASPPSSTPTARPAASGSCWTPSPSDMCLHP
ncbi:LysR family transcriptional regulator [Nonomuraea sp. NPDC050536]|uniref:LysR family transcriptional regulator n=1 Tax=Nonomuraea sp. NPDC050536 TaxID=3364366 RepID=UPI0037CAF2C6